ncbi:restriction endonuclease subunit S [Staphylococcus hominis]|mgnify:CR=1 FL=1|uniref:restriction endonuclease subunit S n=1 Tax=Staphylococcus hominis TaxID=1290 RepID=UPI001F56443A|nr:restriction endonuclease subunit S [Staphylococcus hominis]MCI2847736.1 restriction endonuclease subunit S [Staphylococcus hominis]MCI2849777.1 restriction endonuclease subunit S [Staphylococcus hominis]MCI2856517.1 restriction endonuclease subunit S [Staphylococcus hominis]MCI2886911.1 restriction endonuclease subunit S [Staphylococcus hominis]MDS3852153.1 restriction endonuclease subunit S [Staphylococcus hominis]
MEYNKFKFKDLFEISHGYPFKSSDFSNEKTNFYVMTPGNVKIGGGIKLDKIKYLKKDTEFDKNYIFEPNDIFINMTDLSKKGDTLGFPAIIPDDINNFYLHNQRLGRILNINEYRINKNYLFYLLCTREYRHHILSSATGSTVKHTSPKRILEFEVPLPNLNIQKYIGGLLNKIDKKIIINKNTIANLEELSQTLFKRWFVDFEFPDKDGNPYKSSGGEMIDSELGEIPKNWNILTINDFADDLIITGKTPSTKNKDNYSEKGIPFLTIPDMHTDVFSLNTIKYISEVGIEKVKNKIIPENSLCVSCIATPGLVSITSSETLTNQQINSFTPKKNDLYYLYFYIKNMKKYIEDLGSGGSATLNLNKTQFSKIKIIRPINVLLKKFHKCVDSNFKIILTKQKENLKLQELRDTLLPKLMSGELEIPDDVEVNTDELSI